MRLQSKVERLERRRPADARPPEARRVEDMTDAELAHHVQGLTDAELGAILGVDLATVTDAELEAIAKGGER